MERLKSKAASAAVRIFKHKHKVENWRAEHDGDDFPSQSRVHAH